MKKIFAKLALFTFASILLAMPLQAFAIGCFGTAEDEANFKKDFIITIVEESFGKPTNANNTPDPDPSKQYQSIICCRKTDITADGTASPNLLKGTCPADCPKDDGAKSATCEEVMVILSKGGTSMIEGYISSIYTWAASLVGLIAVTVIIISGIQIAMSGGDTQAVDSGKNRIIKSISGLAVLFLSGLILYSINPNFFTNK